MSNDRTRLDELEIQRTEQARIIEDLHEMVAKQDADISRLRKHVRLLMERAAEAETGTGSAILADQRPPHY